MRNLRIAWYVAFLSACFASMAYCQNADTLTFLHTSDTHTSYALDQFHPALVAKHADSRGKADSLAKFFRTIPNQLKLDGIIITGDLVEIYEGETASHTWLANQVEGFGSLIHDCRVPLYLTLGNHDLTKYSVDEGHTGFIESQTDAGRARASWIRNVPCFHDGTYYAKSFHVGKTTWHFIFLDNGYSLHDGGRVIDKTQLDWLTEQVSSAHNEPIVLFFHIYFSVGDINGDGIFFKENGPLDWPTAKQCSEGFLKLLNENKNIKALVVGHGHSNLFEKIHFPGGNDIYQVETGSVTEDPLNWRLIQCTDKKIIFTRPGGRKPEITIELTQKGE